MYSIVNNSSEAQNTTGTVIFIPIRFALVAYTSVFLVGLRGIIPDTHYKRVEAIASEREGIYIYTVYIYFNNIAFALQKISCFQVYTLAIGCNYPLIKAAV